MRKIAALAEAFKRHCIPHHGLSGLGLAATLHLVCTLPGMVWLELMYEPPTRTIETYQRLGGILETTIWLDREGYVTPPAAPGLGVEVNEGMIAKYAV
jgi:L-alanine-DL-glutamate epimerase-like enolase superfamily enzyme